MNFCYQQTVVFDNGGWIAVDVRAGQDEPLSLSDLAFVVTLAKQITLFEHQRAIRKAKALAAEQARAQQREMPICWPGFRP